MNKLLFKEGIKINFALTYTLCGHCGFKIGKGDTATIGADMRWMHKECYEGTPRPKLKILQ